MYDVAIIGSGIIGITSAIAIQQKCPKVRVTIFTKDTSPNTTSDIAAAIWEPYLVQNTPPQKINRWSKETYEFLIKLWKEGQAGEAGICLQPLTYVTDNKNYQLPDWLKATLGFNELSQEELDTIGKRVGLTMKGGFTFNTFSWECSIALPYLQKMFIKNGGYIVIKEIFNLDELNNYDLIVNCTGLGARLLLGDNLMTPIRGQVTRVSTPWIFHSYIVDSDNSIYVLANTNFTVMGGTKQLEFNTDIDPVDTATIIKNCSLLVPSTRSGKILKHLVGLRPGREQVRLEIELKKIGTKQIRIVHNYGHGGSGITLSIGCATEVADLVDNFLKKNTQHKL